MGKPFLERPMFSFWSTDGYTVDTDLLLKAGIGLERRRLGYSINKKQAAALRDASDVLSEIISKLEDTENVDRQLRLAAYDLVESFNEIVRRQSDSELPPREVVIVHDFLNEHAVWTGEVCTWLRTIEDTLRSCGTKDAEKASCALARTFTTSWLRQLLDVRDHREGDRRFGFAA